MHNSANVNYSWLHTFHWCLDTQAKPEQGTPFKKEIKIKKSLEVDKRNISYEVFYLKLCIYGQSVDPNDRTSY